MSKPGLGSGKAGGRGELVPAVAAVSGSSLSAHSSFSAIPLSFCAGVNNTCGIDAMNPSSKDDFTEFGKLLKEKITQYEKSLHYASFLEALVRDVCISCKLNQRHPRIHCYQQCSGVEVGNMLMQRTLNQAVVCTV